MKKYSAIILAITALFLAIKTAVASNWGITTNAWTYETGTAAQDFKMFGTYGASINDTTFSSESIIDYPTNSSYSYVDLETGIIKFYSDSDVNLYSGIPYHNSIAGASAGYSDTLVFDFSGEVTIEIDFHGELHDNWSAWDFQSYTNFNGTIISPSTSLINNEIAYIFNGTFSVIEGQEYGLSHRCFIQTGWDTSFYAMNTSYLNIIMPEEGSFTSASGVLLTNSADPVPEPATILLFGTGIAGLVRSRIKKKKKEFELNRTTPKASSCNKYC